MGQEKKADRTARLPRAFDHTCDTVTVRTAYRCRAYPDPAQQQVLNRTFGCVRMVWNRTLAARQARWHLEHRSTSYAESDRALTAMKRDPKLAFLTEVSHSGSSRVRSAANQEPRPARAGILVLQGGE